MFVYACYYDNIRKIIINNINRAFVCPLASTTICVLFFFNYFYLYSQICVRFVSNIRNIYQNARNIFNVYIIHHDHCWLSWKRYLLVCFFHWLTVQRPLKFFSKHIVNSNQKALFTFWIYCNSLHVFKIFCCFWLRESVKNACKQKYCQPAVFLKF